MNTTILSWNFAKTDVWSKGIIEFIEIFFKIYAFNLIIPIFACSAGYLYYTLSEILSADNLKKSIMLVAAKGVKKSKV
jgi:hypothetical protein